MIRTISRRSYSGLQVVAVLTAMAMGITLLAQAVSVPHVFVPGDTARADEVNANFSELVRALEALEAEVITQATTIGDLKTQLERTRAVADEFRAMSRFTRLETRSLEGLPGPHVIFEGVNVHVRSGSGITDDKVPEGAKPTGLGNLVIGYNESPDTPEASDRVGSHNLVLGFANRFAGVGGLVTGVDNEIGGLYATVTGGRSNRAVGDFASVSGGEGNVAAGENSSVSGGLKNAATGLDSSVSGGDGVVADEAFDWAACKLTCQ